MITPLSIAICGFTGVVMACIFAAIDRGNKQHDAEAEELYKRYHDRLIKCAWCGRVKLLGDWYKPKQELPGKVVSHGICDQCKGALEDAA